MPMQFEQGKRYRMPVVFGPSISPRQMPDGEPADMSTAKVTTAGVRFLTDPERLDRLLPPGFTLDGDPVVTVEFMCLDQLEWLGGRSYRIAMVHYPARFQGRQDTARGPFLSVLWENRTDCCLTGREEVGYAKIFADIFPPAITPDERRYLASADGQAIVEMSIQNLVEQAPPAPPTHDGILHYYYVPKIGHRARGPFARDTQLAQDLEVLLGERQGGLPARKLRAAADAVHDRQRARGSAAARTAGRLRRRGRWWAHPH